MSNICNKFGGDCDGCGRCEPPIPKCPICGRECEEFYLDGLNNVIGCEKCIKKVESYNNEN